MIRVQIKDDKLRFDVVIELLERKYDIRITNKSGDCLYIWTIGQKSCEISHWTNDNPILEIKKENFKWLVNCLN